MTLIERLEELAKQTKMRVGQHPDYHTILDAIKALKEDEAATTEPETPKKRTRTKKT